MSFRNKLAVAALVPVTALAFAVTTPPIQPNKPPTNRQRIVEWVKAKGKEKFKEKAKDFAYDKVKEMVVDAVMDRGEHWFEGPFKKTSGDHDDFAFAIGFAIDPRMWVPSPSNDLELFTKLAVGNVHTAKPIQDVPGAYVDENGNWKVADLGQSSLKPADPPANQTLAPPPPDSVAGKLQYPNPLDNFLDDDDFDAPQTNSPSVASVTSPTSMLNAPNANAGGHAENAGTAKNAGEVSPANPHSAEPPHKTIWLMAGQNTVASVGVTHPEMGSDRQWHQVTNPTAVPAPAAAAPPPPPPPPPPPAPAPRPANNFHKDGGSSGFGTSGSTGHGNWTGGDHPSHGNVS